MIRSLFVLLFVSVVLVAVSGCGNVSLQGDAMTAAQNSVDGAYGASVRADKDPSTPDWVKVYLQEDFKQWRCFVRSAKKDLAWGPTLPSEQNVADTPGSK